MRELVFCLAIFVATFTCIIGQSASPGSFHVVVKDRNNASVASARIAIRARNGIETVGFTSDAGEFTFHNVATGEYQLKVLADGFGEYQSSIQINDPGVSKEVVLDIRAPRFVVTAEIGQTADSVNVPQAVNVIGVTEIRQRATTFLAQVAEEEVGLNVQRTSPTIGAIVVRGLTGKNVVNFVDGVRFTNGAQRGGINTFFNLNDPSTFEDVEVLRGPNSAQYGSDSLGGTVNLLTKSPSYSSTGSEFHGELAPSFNSADRSVGTSGFFSYGTPRFGALVSFGARRVNTLRTANGLDSHSAITRFLGLPSSVLYDRNPDTEFSQYGGAVRLGYAVNDRSELTFYYNRSQLDDGKRFDQLLGGDGNLIADLRNLMLDFGYLRFATTDLPFFDSGAFTVSYNSQREERVNQGGQGNPVGDVTHQYERTSTTGFNFYLDRQVTSNNTILFGGDFYHEKINSPAYVATVAGVATVSRPRIPDEATFDSAGLYVQDVWDVLPDRLRITGALRYSGAIFKAHASDSPVVSGVRLWSDDSLRAADLSGRIGGVVRITDGLRAAFNYSRGFRYPNMTDLGTLGLTGDGFEVDHLASSSLNGTIGDTALASAISTGLPVEKQRSETSENFDFSLRYQNRSFSGAFTAYRLDIRDAITKQALILPAGAVGQFLGDRQIVSQLPNGTVFVQGVATPVLVRANFTTAELYGIEAEVEGRITQAITARGHFTYNHAADKDSGLPPNIEGGTPPPTAFLSLRYSKSRFWTEAYSTLAAKQDRLSSLDIGDRRTGAARSRAQIQNFFRRGACIHGLTTPGATGCGSAGGILLATGETLAQVQDRLLPIGATINGVTVVDNNTSVPLFTYLPSYATANIRGGFTFNENTSVFAAFENITDSYYRNPSWGIDGAGRSVTVQLRYKF